MINGAATSDGNFTSSSHDTYKGTVQYGSGSSCSAPTQGTFDGTPAKQKLTSDEGYPTTWDLPSICTGSGVVENLTSAINLNGTITDGVYCSTVSITDGSDTTQSVTLIAPSVTIDGNTHQVITPFTENLLAGADKVCGSPPCGTGVTISTNNASVQGDIYAPDEDVDISGNQLAVSFIEAYDIKITTNGFSLTGDGPPVGTPSNSVKYLQ